jgi:hypothetical protein
VELAVLSWDLVTLADDSPHVRHMELQPLQPNFRYRRTRIHSKLIRKRADHL